MEDLHNIVTQYFSNEQYMFEWVTDPLKVQDRAVDFNARTIHCYNFTIPITLIFEEMIFILSFAAVIKEYLQLAEKVIKIFFFSRDVFVKLYLLHNFYQNLTV